MRIVLLGGGTGGHFYPVIAVAQAIQKIAEEERIVSVELVFMGEQPFDMKMLNEEGIFYEEVPAGKIRRYFSLRNITDSFRTLRGIFVALWKCALRPPDLVFSKGGYDSFPVLVAARVFRIPVIIHESDSIPGAVNTWAGRFAARIGISFPESARYFPQNRTALVGHPIRHSILGGSEDEALDIFELETGIPTLLILGGSQGAQKINDVILAVLPDLVEKLQIIHSAGQQNVRDVKAEAGVILEKSQHKKRYHVFPTLMPAHLRNASFIADLIVSRAGAGSIFEIAAWGVPSVLVPLPLSAQDHQRMNAYSYARTGAAEILEETNLTPHVLMTQIFKILDDTDRREEMKKAAEGFARIDAAEKIAREIVHLSLHE